MSSYHFDASAIPPAQERSAIPAGWHPMRIVSTELKTTKDNQGSYDTFELEVISGPHQGRKVFHRITRDNANQTAVRIGQEQLSAYCHATGVIRLTDTQQLCGIPMWVKLSLRNDPEYGEQNEVKAIKRINETPQSAQAMGPTAGLPQQLPPSAPSMPSAPPVPQFVAPTFPQQGFTPPQQPVTQPQQPTLPAMPPAFTVPQTFAQPVAQPLPPPAPTPPAPPSPPQYKIGDKANGYVLTEQGWVLDTNPQQADSPPWARS